MQQACRSWAGRWNSDGLVACLADLQAWRYRQGQRLCLPLGQAPLIPNQRLRSQPHLHRGPTKDGVCPAVAILGTQHSGTQRTVDGSLHQRNGVRPSASTPSPAMVRLRLEAAAAQLRNRRHRAGIGAGCEAAHERCSRRSSRQSEPRTRPDLVALARRHAGKSNAPSRSLPPQAGNTDLPGPVARARSPPPSTAAQRHPRWSCRLRRTKRALHPEGFSEFQGRWRFIDRRVLSRQAAEPDSCARNPKVVFKILVNAVDS